MIKPSCNRPYQLYTAESLTRLDGHRKDKMLEQTGHQNQNSSAWQKELCLASLHNAAKQQSYPATVG